MKGIDYVINDKEKRIAVIIDLKRHAAVWEDFCDMLTAEKRRDEPRESLDSVITLLKKKSKHKIHKRVAGTDPAPRKSRSHIVC